MRLNALLSPVKLLSLISIIFSLLPCASVYAVTDTLWHSHTDQLSSSHSSKTGIYILEKGEEALIARAWLADNAKQSIDVQYFIWSTDNIGTLAAASLLRAADRGVRVRVIVDDLLIDASHDTLYALASHPNIHIRIYNPNLNVGTSVFGKVFNTTLRFRSVNQRMHNKVFIVDDRAVITGGRNMADEYFDYDHEYNFRDRDALLIGEAVAAVSDSFDAYWNSEYVTAVEELIDNPFDQTEIDIFDVWSPDEYIQIKGSSSAEAADIYRFLQSYEDKSENYSPEIRQKIQDINHQFYDIIEQMHWTHALFISDMPGKNDNIISLGGGGTITQSLERVIKSARKSITIQSPYLVMSLDAWKLLRSAVERGVKVKISTNSLSSTDNLAAYSGYARQRYRLIKSGFELYEFKPNASIRSEIINRYAELKDKPPTFAIHAKSLVVDGKTGYIGSFNFDPRSENLNTETGIFFDNPELAQRLEAAIIKDMHPENSWHVNTEGHGHDASIYKKSKVFFMKLLPMDSVL